MPLLPLRNTTIHYEEQGSGSPLLLLHGGLGTALLHFRREISFYAEAGYRVIAPDLRGYGRSSPPREFPLDFYEQDAADMAALLEAILGGAGSERRRREAPDRRARSEGDGGNRAGSPIQRTAPAHLLGWSDGAIVAQVLAVRRPDLVRSLSLWGGESCILEAERANWPPLADPSTWPPRAVERFIDAQGSLNWPGILQKMLDGYNALLDAGGEVISARLGEIRCPVLVAHGEADDVVPVVQAHTLKAGMPHAELQIFPGAGHALHREREAELRALVLDFLRRVETSG